MRTTPMMRRLAAVFLLLLVAACTEQTILPPLGADAVVATYPPHERKVRLIKGGLPQGTQYEILGRITVVEQYYGPQSKAETSLAGVARKLGADAVIDERAWQAPRAFASNAPHAEGTAVKLRSPPQIDLDTVPGEWF